MNYWKQNKVLIFVCVFNFKQIHALKVILFEMSNNTKFYTVYLHKSYKIFYLHIYKNYTRYHQLGGPYEVAGFVLGKKLTLLEPLWLD